MAALPIAAARSGAQSPVPIHVDPPVELTSFQKLLSGEGAFYNQPDYVKITKRNLAQTEALPVTYRWDTENKVIRVVKQIFSIIFFPVVLWQLLHALAGKAIVPASSPCLTAQGDLHKARSSIFVEQDVEWKYKRITIEVDGYQIDAMIVGKVDTLANKRWLLASSGNDTPYESLLTKQYTIQSILSDIQGNAILFNYPGVGASSGLPNRAAMAKAYRAILKFLEEEVGAKEIVGHGYSLGAAVQAEALNTHTLKQDVKYVFVKSHTFSNLSRTVSELAVKVLKLSCLGSTAAYYLTAPVRCLVSLLGWNMDTVASSKKLTVPEIILQTTDTEWYEEPLEDSSKIIDDDLLSPAATLAKALMDDDPQCPKKNKLFIGVPEMHGEPLRHPEALADWIRMYLQGRP